MAHILFISPYYLPEKAAAAVCVSENTKRLVKLRHQVTVLTTVPHYPTGIVPAEYCGNLIIRIWKSCSVAVFLSQRKYCLP